jgi:2-oxo-4-hydroxy-4-carboxy--5-ureidoimidazoline (OHCU) decarboxylase
MIKFLKNLFKKSNLQKELELSKVNHDVLKKLIEEYRPGFFVPYIFYNKHRKCLQVYLKDEISYTQPLTLNLELHISQTTKEIVGINIFRAEDLICTEDNGDRHSLRR